MPMTYEELLVPVTNFAALALGLSFWLQTWKIFRSKSVGDLSLPMLVIFLFVCVAFFAYSAHRDEIPFMIANGMGAPASFLNLVGYFLYRKRGKQEKSQNASA